MFKLITLACLVGAAFGAGHHAFEALPQTAYSAYAAPAIFDNGYVEGAAATIEGGATTIEGGAALAGGEVVVENGATTAAHQSGAITINAAPAAHQSGEITINAAPAAHHSGEITINAAPAAHHSGAIAFNAAPALVEQAPTVAISANPAIYSSGLIAHAQPAAFIGAAPAKFLSYSAGVPTIQTYTTQAAGYVKNIYADHSHVHPGVEKIYRYRTAPKIRKEVALVGRVVHQPKIKVLQVVKQPNVRQYTVVHKPQQKIVNILPAKVSHTTRVYKAPEPVYKTKNYYAAKTRETSGNIVSIERAHIAPESYFQNGAFTGFEGANFDLTIGGTGNLGNAADAAATAAQAAGAQFETSQLNLGLGTTGRQTITHGADGSTTTTTSFHANSGSAARPIGSLDAAFAKDDSQTKSESN